METDARYTLVGLIVLGLIASLAIAVVWLSNSGSNETFPRYTIYFKEESPAGLQIDGDVTMRGIRIGKVKELALSRKDIEQVRVVIEAQPGTPVKKDTRALVQRNLLTGLASIDLTGGSQEAAPLTEVLNDEKYPIIAEGSSGLAKLQKSVPELMASANTLFENASKFFSVENQKSVEGSLKNLEVLSTTLANNRDDIDKIIANASQVVSDFKTLSRTMSNGVGETSEALRAAITSLALSVTSVSENVTRAAKSFKSTTDRIDNPRSIITGPAGSALGPGEGK
jgi:phospholipid/cholesterol/gamma-HCH transport system substrate-binding protein